MRGKIAVLILLSALCFAGCSSKGEEETTAKVEKGWSEKTTFVMSVRGSETENGIILNGGEMYLYYDEGSKILTPLCSRADCDHTSADTCTARLLMDQSTGVIGYYDGSLWFFGWDDDVITLCRADADGNNKKDLFQIDVGISAAAECYIYDGVLYLLEEQIDFTSEEMDETCRIAAVDLETGEVKGISEVTEDMQRLRGMDDNRLYYSDYKNEEDRRTGYVYCYDCDTQETTKLSLDEDYIPYAAAGNDYLVYNVPGEGQESYYYIIDPETGEELASVSDEGEESYGMTFPDQFLIKFADGYYRYDAKSRTETYITNDKVLDYYIVWPVTGGYLVKIVEDHYITDTFAFWSEENLKNGGGAELLE